MQYHVCKFSRYCGNYRFDNCQGCPEVRLSDTWNFTNPIVEEFKKRFNQEEIMTKEQLNRLMKCNAPTEATITRDPVKKPNPLDISRVIFSDPATIVLWKDGSKTIVKCQEGDTYSKETGLALCIAKKAFGNKPNFNNIFRKWIPEE